ncbi:MAG: hypothetical protein M1818_000377 [Claussenomyces sp. TS43310]|nr:MAG: hypothetical protein M1818_000377 [Claussenomyces sp. TS43310]
MALQDARNPSKSKGGIYARLQNLADRVISPDTRQQVYVNVRGFADEQPFLASFILIQVILSFTPIAIFASFVLGTLLLSFVTALLFSLFWIGAALLVLVPTLFVSVSLGIGVWIWAVSSFLVARWVYNLIPVNVKGGMEVNMPNGKTMIVNKTGEGYGDVEAKVESDFVSKDFNNVPMETKH